jgi:hypothetical protein
MHACNPRQPRPCQEHKRREQNCRQGAWGQGLYIGHLLHHGLATAASRSFSTKGLRQTAALTRRRQSKDAGCPGGDELQQLICRAIWPGGATFRLQSPRLLLATRRNCTNICTAVPSHQAASHTTWHRFKGRLRWRTTPWRRRPVRAASQLMLACPGSGCLLPRTARPAPQEAHTDAQVSTAGAAHIRAGQISLPAGAAVDIGMPAQACVQGAVLGA